jgi:heme/copper-type cytochrome/quinol oxidase subunit 4
VETLNQLLVGVYLTEDHRAKYHQNDFLRFQWSFTFLAFFSTMVATLTVVYSTLSPLFSIITTILGGFVTLFVYAYNRERPQRRWYERRRSAEALRRHYYQYLVHLAPYHTANHRYVLQLMVDRIRKNSSDPLPVQPDAKPRKSHTRREIDAIYDIYLKQRVAGQKNYYKYKADECDFNSDLTFLMGGLLPFAATVVSAWTMFNTSQSLSALVIILPALAAIFISFQRIYDWDRQFSIFIRTYEGLQTAEIVDETIDDKRALLLELVGRVESILASEADQWGQALVERDAELSAEQVLNEFIKKTGLKDKNRIAEIRGMLDLPDDDEEDKDKDGIPDRKPSRPNAEG